MALYLVQHGRSLPKEIDPDQGLSPEGMADTEHTARLSKNFGLKIDGILQSGKTPARQTAEILAATLDPPDGIREASGLGPLDDVAPLEFSETRQQPHAGRPPALHGAAGGAAGDRIAGKTGHRISEQRHRLPESRRLQRKLGDPLGPDPQAMMRCLRIRPRLALDRDSRSQHPAAKLCFFDIGVYGYSAGSRQPNTRTPKYPISYFPQISDTSTSTSLGNLATSTVSRAGGVSPK